MRIFVLGAGATGSLLAHLLDRQGHIVTCGDRDVVRARRFLGKKSHIPVQEVNARNLWAIVRAARGNHLLVNTGPAIFNEIILRAALRLRVHYVDLAARMTKHPFKTEQIRFHKRFVQKNRMALITAGVSPGLTNLLAKRAAERLDSLEAIHIRLCESSQSDDPISQWSHEESFNVAVSRPRIYRAGRFHLAKRFGERELFRFAAPVGITPVYLAAQDETCTLPYFLKLRDMDVKIGGNEFDRLRRWYRQGKLSRSRGLVSKHFPKTLTPRMVAKLIRRGQLQNARFAAAVLVRGLKNEEPLLIRWDCGFPTLYQIRLHGMFTSPIAYASAQMAALFIKHFPREMAGVYPPEALPIETRQAILAEVSSRRIRITLRITRLKKTNEEEEM
jgi:saccharopine dehydrogenase (NAD+, L-lysine-forming)